MLQCLQKVFTLPYVTQACASNPCCGAWACRNICVQQAPDVSVKGRVQLFVRSLDAFHPWVACGCECYLAKPAKKCRGLWIRDVCVCVCIWIKIK